MIFSKLKAYIYLQAICIGLLLCYQAIWYLSPKTEGIINKHKIKSYTKTGGYTYVYDVEYYVNDEMYFVRENEMPLSNEVRYNVLFPSYASINTNTNLWAPIYVCYILFFIVTSIVFLPIKNNQIISNGSSIQFSKVKPYIKIIPPK